MPENTDFSKTDERNRRNIEICHIIQTGTPEEKKEARECLVKENDGLIWAVISKYNSSLSYNYEREDAFQEGAMGLLRAAETFDPSMGSFSTYAVLWIRQKVTRGTLDYSNTIRVPVNLLQYIGALSKEYKAVPGSLEFIKALEKDDRISDERKNSIISALHNRYCISLDPPMANNDENDTVGELIPDERYSLESEVIANSEAETLRAHVSKLNEREIFVITNRYGLETGMPKTLQEVADMFEPKLTRERVRQIEAIAIKKLKLSYAKEIRLEGSPVPKNLRVPPVLSRTASV